MSKQKISWFNGGSLFVNHTDVFLEDIDFSLKVLHISDLHLNENDDLLLEELKEKISGIDIDLVTIAGDFISNDKSIDFIPNLMASLPTGVPIVAVFGNHDFERHNTTIPIFGNVCRFLKIQVELDIDLLRKRLKDQGVICLEDSHTIVPVKNKEATCFFYGISQTKCSDEKIKVPSDLLEKHAPANALKVILVHRPDFSSYASNGFHLILGGHTHGGQIKFPLFGPLTSNCKVSTKFSSGHYKHGGAQWIVNNGFSADNSMRIRLNAPRQISILNITKGTPPNLKELKLKE